MRIVFSSLLLALGLNVNAQAEQPVTIKFQAMVGDQEFHCDGSYKLGASNAPVQVSDFRFYVSDVALLNHHGEAIPVTLEQDQRWQYQNVALLDFEDKAAGCGNGTVETRDHVTGTVAEGDYAGLQFTLGVPFELNHEDATIAPSPLNLTSLFWNWRGGYKFARIDIDNPPGAAVEGFAIHLGSTGCKAEQKTQRPSGTCKNPNTVTVTFTDFDPTQDVVIADLAKLVVNSDVTSNTPETRSGCMSFPGDKDCPAVMRQFGLNYGKHKADSEQVFFRPHKASQ